MEPPPIVSLESEGLCARIPRATAAAGQGGAVGAEEQVRRGRRCGAGAEEQLLGGKCGGPGVGEQLLRLESCLTGGELLARCQRDARAACIPELSSYQRSYETCLHTIAHTRTAFRVESFWLMLHRLCFQFSYLSAEAAPHNSAPHARGHT